MALQEYYNSLGGATVKRTGLQDYYNTLASKGRKRLYEAEVKDTGISPSLYSQLRSGGKTASEVKAEIGREETPSFLQEFVSTPLKGLSKTKSAIGNYVSGQVKGLKQIIRGVRASSQLLATPVAGVMATPRGGVSPSEAMVESLKLAKETLTGEKPIDYGVKEAGQLWLKNRGVGKYGGNSPDIADVAALSILGFANIFGDPVFEVALGLKAYKGLKSFAQFKKVQQVTKKLPTGVKILKGKTLEIPVDDVFKVKIQPKTNEVIFKNYQKRFLNQKALPAGKLSSETTDLIMATRNKTGMGMIAKFQGDDLILKAQPDKLIKPAIKVTDKAVQSLAQEAKKFDTADEFVKSRKIGFHITPIEKSTIIDTQGIKAPEGTQFRFGKEEQIPSEVFIWEDKNIAEKFKILKEQDGGKFVIKEVDLTGLKLRKDPEAFEDFVPGVKGNGLISDSAIPSERIVTKSQLTDIFNQAKETPDLVSIPKKIDTKPALPKKPTKTSKVAKDIEFGAIEKGAIKEFEGLAGFDPITVKDQAQRASKVLKDIENAKKMITGEIPIESGLNPSMLVVQAEKLAIKTGDIDLLREVARSPLVSAGSEAGQTIRILAERDQNSPVQSIRSVNKARTKKVTEKKLTVEEKAIKREIKAVKKSEQDLTNFIKSIIC